MKKGFLMLVAMLLMLSMCVAHAAPSIQANNVPSTDSLMIVLDENSEKIKEVVEKLQANREAGKADVEILNAETVEAIDALLPEGVKKEDLQVTAYCQVPVYHVELATGDVKATFTFDTVYKQDQVVIPVVRLITVGPDGEEISVETVLEAAVLADGSVEMTFPIELLRSIDICNNTENGHADLAVFSN